MIGFAYGWFPTRPTTKGVKRLWWFEVEGV